MSTQLTPEHKAELANIMAGGLYNESFLAVRRRLFLHHHGYISIDFESADYVLTDKGREALK